MAGYEDIWEHSRIGFEGEAEGSYKEDGEERFVLVHHVEIYEQLTSRYSTESPR